MNNKQKIDHFLIQIQYFDTFELNTHFDKIDFSDESSVEYFISSLLLLNKKETTNSPVKFFNEFQKLRINDISIKNTAFHLIKNNTNIQIINSNIPELYDYIFDDENTEKFINFVLNQNLKKFTTNPPNHIVVKLLEKIREDQLNKKKTDIEPYMNLLKTCGHTIYRLLPDDILKFLAKLSFKEVFPFYPYLGFEKFEFIISEKMKIDSNLAFLDYHKSLGETFTTRLLLRNENNILHETLNFPKLEKFKLDFYQFLFKNSTTFKHVIINCMEKDLDLSTFVTFYETVDKSKLNPKLELFLENRILEFKIQTLPFTSEQQKNRHKI